VLDAEQIDILRGPAAIAYGGGAIGGVINIVDGRIPSRPVDGPLEGQAYAGATSVDDGWQLAGRARTNAGPFVLQLEGSRRQAGDFDIPGFAESARLRAAEEEEDEAHEQGFGTVPNSGFEFETVGAGATLIGDWGFFGVSVRDYDAQYGLPGHHHEGEEETASLGGGALSPASVSSQSFAGVPHIEMDQTRYDARGELAFELGPFNHIDVSAGFADYQHAELEETGEVGTLFQNEGWEGRAALVNGERGDTWSGSLGVSGLMTDFSATGEEAFVPPVETSDWGVFAAQRVDLGGYGFEGGLRLETRKLEPAGAQSRSFDTTSAALGAFLRPADGMFVSASLTRTERAPSDQELFANGPHAATETFEIGDPNLGEETGLSFDVTARITRDRWIVEAGGFHSNFQDFIYLAPTDGEMDGLPVARFVQDDATLWGGELYLERTLASIGPWELITDGTLEYVRGETDGLGDLPRMPPFSAIFGAGLERDFVDLRGELEYVAEQDDVAAFELPTDGYTFVNFSATLRPFDSAARIVVEARNITDEEGRLHTSQLKDVIPLPGRAFRIGVLTRF
jgi:iron complex outermembrane receptor protein